MEEASLIVSTGVYVPAILKDIKKSPDHFQPIYEAFTNSFESIKLEAKKGENPATQYITIEINQSHKLTESEIFFENIVVTDSGSGFDEENFKRLLQFKNDQKGFFNKGSGRIQFLHFFAVAKYESSFFENRACKRRTFVLSTDYVRSNAIVSGHNVADCELQQRETVLTLKGLKDEGDLSFYNDLSAVTLKEMIISRYIMDLCTHRNSLPIITIKQLIDNKIIDQATIKASDIPLVDKETDIPVSYCRPTIDGKDFEAADKLEIFKLTAFKISEHELKRNELKFSCKGEIVPKNFLELKTLSPHDQIDGNRYLFLLSGVYIDERDEDTRGVINIRSREDSKKANRTQTPLFSETEIFLDDIEYEANKTISKIYPEIVKKKEEKERDIEKLREMFLLNPGTLRSVRISINDTEERILEKVYSADSKVVAKNDAEIKKKVDALEDVDPASRDYPKKLNAITSELVKLIPLQNRTALTHYVARRKLVLELFDRVLQRELQAQKIGQRNIDEKLLHNVIFQQSSKDPADSDLWLINEDFIYFKGASDGRLCDIKLDGKPLLKQTFSPEEERYLNSLGENRTLKRPDILLFPDEGKCIIIEFKNPDVNINSQISQINQYAYFIRNFSEAPFEFETFYGYLIGESIEVRDVRSCDSNFIPAYHFDYLFRPHYLVAGEDGRRDGSLYTEVIKYTTLLKRAQRRNEIFISKLMGSSSSGAAMEQDAPP